MAKEVAESLKSVTDHPVLKSVLDRSSDISSILDEVSSWWQYDLYDRKPAPAHYLEGNLVKTTMLVV